MSRFGSAAGSVNCSFVRVSALGIPRLSHRRPPRCDRIGRLCPARWWWNRVS